MATTNTKPKRMRKAVETFEVETVSLRPIAIEDPERALVEASAAADLLQVTRATMTGYMDRGTLTTVRRSGSTRRWLLRDEVNALAALRGTPAGPGVAL